MSLKSFHNSVSTLQTKFIFKINYFLKTEVSYTTHKHIINQNYSNIEDEELKFEYVIIYYWYSSLYFSLKKREKAIEYANIAINIVDKSKNKRTSIIDEKGLKSIYEQLVQIKTASINQKPIVKTKKYGRNDRVKVKYKDGNIQENKYKKLEADILAERCVII